MSSLALLGGANPRVCVSGPVVRLDAGDWKVRHVGVIDSVLSLHDGAVLAGNGVCQVTVVTPGTEEYISVFVEQIHGT